MSSMYSGLRSLLLAAVAIVLLSQTSSAQGVDVIIGTQTTQSGTTSYPNPYGVFYSQSRHQMLLTVADITAAGGFPGSINSVAFDVASNAGGGAICGLGILAKNFTVKIKATTATTLSAFDNASLTAVWGPTDYTPTNGWNVHQFSTPFVWDGTSNIIIETCFDRGNNCYDYQASIWYSTANAGSTIYSISDGLSGSMCVSTTSGSVTSSRPRMRLNISAGIDQSFPEDRDPRRILSTSLYNGSSGSFPAPSLTFRRNAGQTVNLQYKIVGPLPSTNVVYRALNSSTITDSIIPINTGTGLLTQTFSYATGPLAGANGALDARSAVGGAYQVQAVYNVPAINFTQTWNKQFIIAYTDDLSAAEIVTPRTIPYKYLRNLDIPVQARFQNVGLNNVTSARYIATITNSSNQVVYRDTVNYNNASGLTTGNNYTAEFKKFNIAAVGLYTLQICGELLNGTDLNPSNNCLPVSGTHQFEVQYDTEIAADAIIAPASSSLVFVNRPLIVIGRYKNNGAADGTDISTTITIERLTNGNWVTVYGPVEKVLPDISFTLPATAILAYDPWTPTQVGTYRACITSNAFGDPVASNNTTCLTFDVVDGMNGTYTIGTANSGNSRNFTTIQNAVDALYQRGVTGPVTFEMTDGSYSVGTYATGQPALDMSAKILGVSSVNTITFKPALLRSLSRASVGIRLQSGNGIGVFFGQVVLTNNFFSALNQYKNPVLYGNPSGYITFDGGDQKAFRFMLDVGTTTPTVLPQRAVFYLGNGSSNIAVKNSLIENYPQSTASYAAELPVVRYISPNFTFDADVRILTSGPESYSAGIVSRAQVPSNGGNNSLGLDTLCNNNNKFIGNEISGFGYGIVDIGIGTLLYNDLTPDPNNRTRYDRYYNKNNEISKNVIMSVRRAGVYVGYGENEKITDNRILNVGIGATGVSGSAAGIMVGGAARANEYIYNNIRTQVLRNEISNISSDVAAGGILVEQSQNSFINPGGGTVTFPNVNEAINVAGNIIYAINRTNQTATAAGIHFLTQRLKTATGLTRTITPQVNNYMTRGDSVVNNTVIMNADAVTSGASVVALGVQHAQGAVVMNNALAIQGTAASVNTAAGNSLATFFYQGMQPKTGALLSNRNAFWAPNGAITRFVEIDNISQILDLGAQNDYISLGQWKAWTGQDINSVVGNFPADHVTSATSPSKLRVNISPLPLGSILDRRGDRTGAGLVDIDGDPRGLNGSRFTIGADEFVGRLYVNDIEAIEVLTPVSYRSSAGLFSDAEYVMTTAPVNVTARMRNNGSGSQAGVTVVAEIWQEDPSGQFTSMVSSRTQQVSMGAGESVDIDFGFDKNATFVPQSYAALGWSSFAPAQFSTMLNNVTPRYQIRIYTTTDEFNTNNQVRKEVRFYILKSNLKLLTSAVSSNVATPSTYNERVGRLNNDSLAAGFNAIGIRTSNLSLDMFERSGWEPRAVNYTIYRTMFWAGDTTRLTRLQREDMRAFINAGTANDKKNLVMSSQEVLGKHVGLDAINDEQFVRYVLRATKSPQAATPRVVGYDAQNIKGIALARDIVERVSKTGHAVDGTVMPMPSLMRIYSDAQSNGLARAAYSYVTRDAGVTDSIMGVATAGLNYNVVFLGADWRHFARTGGLTGNERVIRSIIEFIERNGGIVVPVELVGFDAKRAGEQVNVSWETASEKNSSHFNVERAVVSEKGRSEFNVIRTVPAKGTSVAASEYGISDANVIKSESYVYRLKMVDLDGRSEYSNEVLVSAVNEGSALSVVPNPAVAERPVTVNFTSNDASVAEITLVDINGREVLSNVVNTVAGNNVVNLNVPNVSTGTYVVVVKQGASVQNFNVQITR